MARDVKFWKEDGSFKLRVCGVVQVGDKILIDNCDNAPFWGYPGGHVELGESTREAVVREVKEEIGVDAEIIKNLASIQLFFTREDGKPFHEIGFYYLMKANIEPKNLTIEENDKGKLRKHQFRWVTKEELKNLDVRPTELKKVILNDLENQEIISYVTK
mgnify:CR=1 FL=1